MMEEKATKKKNQQQRRRKKKSEREKKPHRNIEYSTNNCFECIESKNKLKKIAGKL